MKKYILLLLTTIAFGQTYQNPTYGTITTKTNTESTTATKINVQETSGLVNWLQPVNIPIPTIPTNYNVITPTLGGHLSGIDAKLGTVSTTTAGVTTRVWFTADQVTITAGTFDLTNPAGKGTASSHQQTVANDDGQKKYFTTDLIGQPFAAATVFPQGTYAGNLTASTTPTNANQKFTVELYKCNNAGTPIASGVTGAPVGSLGVTVVMILDSGEVTLANASVTNVAVSTILSSTFSIAVGERIRYHVSAEKVGTAGGVINESVYYGTAYNSYLDVPVTFNLQTNYNNSVSPQITTTAGLGAITIRRGSAADTDNILVGQNGAGIVTSNITGAGAITGSSGALNGSLIAVSAVSRGLYISTNHLATANNDRLISLDIGSSYNTGGFTGVASAAIRVNGTITPSADNTSPLGFVTANWSTTRTRVVEATTGGFLDLGYGGTVNARNYASGRWVFQNGGTFTDNGVDIIQASGSVLATGYKVAGTTGYLKSDGTVDVTGLTLPANPLGTTPYKIRQEMATNDLWSIYGDASIVDQGKLVFEVGDNGGTGVGANGQSFEFRYNASNSGVAKTPFIIDYNTITANANLAATGNVTANAIDTNTTKITITTAVSITTATTDANGIRQDGRHVVIDNGVNVINITCNGGVTTSYGKVGTGAITFAQGSGRTLVQLSGTAVLNGIAGSTASLWSHGTTDYLSINNY